MMFRAQEIEDKDSLGYFLRLQRERMRLGIAEVARKTSVSEEYINCLEQGEYHKLPGFVYCKNFIKRYVEFLGFSLEDVLDVYGKELEVAFAGNDIKQQPYAPLAVHNFITWPKVMRASIMSIVAVLLFGYVGYLAYGFLQPPELTVYEPQDNMVVQSSEVVVMGFTDDGVEVSINTRPVVVSEGEFAERLELQEGINEIVIAAEKKHGRSTRVIRTVILDDTEKQVYHFDK